MPQNSFDDKSTLDQVMVTMPQWVKDLDRSFYVQKSPRTKWIILIDWKDALVIGSELNQREQNTSVICFII